MEFETAIPAWRDINWDSGIVMIDSINKKRRVGMPVWSEHDAVAGAMPARILAS